MLKLRCKDGENPDPAVFDDHFPPYFAEDHPENKWFRRAIRDGKKCDLRYKLHHTGRKVQTLYFQVVDAPTAESRGQSSFGQRTNCGPATILYLTLPGIAIYFRREDMLDFLLDFRDSDGVLFDALQRCYATFVRRRTSSSCGDQVTFYLYSFAILKQYYNAIPILARHQRLTNASAYGEYRARFARFRQPSMVKDCIDLLLRHAQDHPSVKIVPIFSQLMTCERQDFDVFHTSESKIVKHNQEMVDHVSIPRRLLRYFLRNLKNKDHLTVVGLFQEKQFFKPREEILKSQIQFQRPGSRLVQNFSTLMGVDVSSVLIKVAGDLPRSSVNTAVSPDLNKPKTKSHKTQRDIPHDTKERSTRRHHYSSRKHKRTPETQIISDNESKGQLYITTPPLAVTLKPMSSLSKHDIYANDTDNCIFLLLLIISRLDIFSENTHIDVYNILIRILFDSKWAVNFMLMETAQLIEIFTALTLEIPTEITTDNHNVSRHRRQCSRSVVLGSSRLKNLWCIKSSVVTTVKKLLSAYAKKFVVRGPNYDAHLAAQCYAILDIAQTDARVNNMSQSWSKVTTDWRDRLKKLRIPQSRTPTLSFRDSENTGTVAREGSSSFTLKPAGSPTRSEAIHRSRTPGYFQASNRK